MGNRNCSPDSSGGKLTQFQRKLRKIGESYPFSDEELYVLYKCHRNQMEGSYVRELNAKRSFIVNMVASAIKNSAPSDDSLDDDSIGSMCMFDMMSVLGTETETREEDDEKEAEERQKEQDRLLKATIEISSVEKYILPPGFGERLKEVLCFGEEYQKEADFVNSFLYNLTRCLGRKQPRHSLEVLFECCRRTIDGIQMAKAHDLITLGFRLAVSAHVLSSEQTEDFIPPEESALLNLSKSLLMAIPNSCTLEHAGMVSKEVFVEWAERTSPLLFTVLPTFMHAMLFSELPFSSARQNFLFPRLDQKSSFFECQFSPRLFSYGCMSQTCGSQWKQLFTSEVDGLSFNRLCLQIMGYAGPTLMIIRASDHPEGIFGAFSPHTWKESKDFFGNCDCFLYQLEPITQVYYHQRMENNFVYCNPEARSKGYDQQAHGLGFGGNCQQPRLFISENLDGCIASSADLTFENGALLPALEGRQEKEHFDLQTLEVWGVGGELIISEALQARREYRMERDKKMRKAQNSDRCSVWENSSAARKVKEDVERGGCNLELMRKTKNEDGKSVCYNI